MVQTRHSYGLARVARPIETASPTVTPKDAIDKVFEIINREAGLLLHFHETESPSKRRKSPGHDAVKHINFLYYQDYDELLKALNNFRLQSPALRNNDERLNFLLEALTTAVDSTKRQGTPRSGRRWPPPSLQASQSGPLPETVNDPSSPTLSVKHAPRLPLELPGYPQLPPPIPLASKPSVSTILDEESFHTAPMPPLDLNSGTTDLNISFDSGYGSAGKPSQEEAVSPTGSYHTVPDVDGANDVPRTQETRYDGPMSSYEAQYTGLDLTQQSNYAGPMSSMAASEFEEAELKAKQRADTPIHSLQQPDTRQANSAISAQPSFPQSVNPKTPTKAAPLLPPKTPKTSPSKHPRVRKIPLHGLSQMALPSSFVKLRFDLCLEAYRVLQTEGITAEELDKQWTSPRTMVSLHEVADRKGIQFKKGFETDFSDATLCAKLRWSNKPTGSLLILEFLPPRKEKRNDLQRKYGGDRLLCIDSDSPSRPPCGISGNETRDMFARMICQDQQLLGRRWFQFFMREKKRKKNISGSNLKPGMQEIFLFATSGPDIDTVDPDTFVNWSMVPRQNFHQLSGKLYDRWTLLLSRTTAGPRFTRDQVEFASNITATDIPDDARYNDPRLQHLFSNKYEKDVVMNDGTSMISAYAMRKACQMGDYTGPTPAMLQGRWNGNKGTWLAEREANGFHDNEPPDGKQFTASKSQTKIIQDGGDDHVKMTLGIVGFNLPPKPSVLHTTFLPILNHGGVPANVICQYVAFQVQQWVDDLAKALQHRNVFRRWLHEQNEIQMAVDRELGIETTGGLPSLQSEKIIQMLESGFEPLKCKFLAEEVFGLVKKLLSLKMKNFKIPCPRAVQLMGGADPTGTLEPGEVHIVFSTPFPDPTTGRNFDSWEGMPCLVGRNPARRRSDIRKLRVVRNPGLEHIRDVALFSTKGRQPEASKMQGGDYDGDTFWICAEPKLVDPFRNAPAPRESDLPDPSELFIEKDERRFCDIVTIPVSEHEPLSEEQLRQWIAINTANRLEFNYLGSVTRQHEELTYHQNDIDSAEANAFNNLLDYLIDAPKRCLKFNSSSLEKFKEKFNIPKKLEKPAHRKYTSLEEDDEKKDGPKRWNENNIIDKVFFEVLEKVCSVAVERIGALLSPATAKDGDLTCFYHKMMESATRGSTIHAELKLLPLRFVNLRDEWKDGMGLYNHTKQESTSKKNSIYTDCIKRCRTMYESIKPVNIADEAIQQWLVPIGNDTLTLWDLLKASAFAVKAGEHPTGWKLLFNTVGDELCLLKAPASGPTRTLTIASYALLKPGKYTAFSKVSDNDDQEDDDEDNDEGGLPNNDFGLNDLNGMTSPGTKRRLSDGGEREVGSPSKIR